MKKKDVLAVLPTSFWKIPFFRDFYFLKFVKISSGIPLILFLCDLPFGEYLIGKYLLYKKQIFLAFDLVP